MMAWTGLRSALLAAALLAASAFGAQSTLSSSNIGGLYCGTALSGGRLVEVRTMLIERNGLLAGTYDFADRGETSSGELQESMAQSGRTRTLVWRDKYGAGLVTFDFDDTGASFTGRWGVSLEVPTLPWDGKRCETPSV